MKMRAWQKKISNEFHGILFLRMAKKDSEIVKLKYQISVLTASHVAMMRAIGELGGFPKWLNILEKFKAVRDELSVLGAMPKADSEAFRRRRK